MKPWSQKKKRIGNNDGCSQENKKSYFGALTNYWKSDIVVLVTDIQIESEQPKMKKRCYIYTRVSTAAQIEGYSLEAQTERLREYVDYRELEIAGEYTVETVVCLNREFRK